MPGPSAQEPDGVAAGGLAAEILASNTDARGEPAAPQSAMRTRTGAAMLCSLGLTACGGGGGGSGGGGDLYPLWVETDVAVADLDGDGRPDILTLAQYASSDKAREGRLIVHLQRTPGVFTTVQTAIVGVYPWRMAVADIDGDGALDVAVSDVDGDRGAWLLVQDRANRGQFLPAREIAAGFNGYDIAVADLNGDTLADIAVTSSAARLAILYQDPLQPAAFQPAASITVQGTATTAVTTGDLDGDGRADLAMNVIQSASGGAVNSVTGISLQQGDGSMGPVTTLAPQQGINVTGMTIADYDGDGFADVFAYFTPSSTSYRSKMMVLLQGPVPGAFAAPADTSMGDLKGEMDAVFADLDGDQRPDAAVVGFYPSGSPTEVKANLHRFTQSGAGHFALVSTTPLSIDASCVTAGDLDGDGRKELVVLADRDRFQVLD